MKMEPRYKPRPICSRRCLLMMLALVAAPWVGGALMLLALR